MSDPSALYQRRRRDRLRASGLVKRELWIRPEHADVVRRVEAALRLGILPVIPRTRRTVDMADRVWTFETLLAALESSTAAQEGELSVARVEGVDPVMIVTMHDFGDLPVTVSVAGGEIQASVLLWPAATIADQAAFNHDVLRTHKLLTLSTFGITNGPDGTEWYELFGSLSAESTFETVLIELETLADNAIDVTETYADRLVRAAA
jgi:hypothetical protein